MAGCQDTEYGYDAYFQGRLNGTFSFVAIRALAKLYERATFRQSFDANRKVLPSPQYPQTPNLFGSRSMKSWKVFV